MADKPILIFPQATVTNRSTRSMPLPALIYPAKDIQLGNFNAKISNLNRMFANETIGFNPNINGLIPEMILVFEIAGSIEEFFKAVEFTSGMEYLMEYQNDFLEEGSGFFYRDINNRIVERPIEKRVFVSLTNQRGINELLSYWNSYKYDESFVRGTAKFRLLFNQLNDIRPYNINDRLRDTGFEKYLEDLRELGVESIKFEIEFVYHNNEVKRNGIIQEINSQLSEIGGHIINESITVIDSIKYFGAIAEAPIAAFVDLSLNSNIIFLQSHRVLFFKPVGQLISKEIERVGDDLTENNVLQVGDEFEQPIVALLDGLPLENHQTLNGKLIVDDPDNFSSIYPPANRCHGTAIASLIINGGLDNPTVIKSKLYVRPILKLYTAVGNSEERLPEDRLVVDLIHRTIVRMFEGEAPVAGKVKIINFSIGDQYRPFLQTISTWAKLLDYLSYKYKVLFIISAGNYTEDIKLKQTSLEFESLTSEQKLEAFYTAIFERNFERKILTPSESINSLTVGSLHLDNSIFPGRVGLYNPCTTNNLPSLYSRIGYGYNKSIKPEILFEGGRSTYRISRTSPEGIELRSSNGYTNYPPGIKIAIPGQAGTLNSIGFSIGTSNSTALITNKACKLYEILEEINRLQEQNGQNTIPKDFYAVLIKTLLVHYSDLDIVKERLLRTLQYIPDITDKTKKEYIIQNTGYGILNKAAFGICNEKRVTIIGFGKLKRDEGHIYKFPLPDALSGTRISKTLKISLGWLSPINFNSGKYKMAQLYFDNIKSSQNDLFLDRDGTDVNSSKRGTIQHDVLSNETTDVYIQNSELGIKVNCKEQASGLSTRINKYEIEYGLAVSLEVVTNSEINIYDEIKTKLSPRVRITR